MLTTVHVPPALLKSVDRRAKALGVSRNRLIVRALERVVNDRSGWAPEFRQQLRNADPNIQRIEDDGFGWLVVVARRRATHRRYVPDGVAGPVESLRLAVDYRDDV